MNDSSSYPLTQRQKLVLLTQEMHSESRVFHLAYSHRIFSAIETKRFISAFNQLVLCTDALRTVIGPDDQGGFTARVLSGIPSPLEFHDLSASKDPELAMNGIWGDRAWGKFELARCAYSSWLFRLGPQEYVWALKIHHAVFDGASASLLFRRLEHIYLNPGIEPKEPQFGSLAYARALTPEADKEYWNMRLADLDGAFSFFGERPEGHEFEVESFEYEFPEKTVAAIERLAQSANGNGLSKAARQCSVFASVLGVYLLKAAQTKNVAFALTHHGRHQEAESQVIGLLIQVLPICFNMNPSADFNSLLARVQEEFQETLSHPDYTFANPLTERLLNVGLNYRARRYGQFEGGRVETHWLHSGWSEFSLSLDVIESDAGLQTLVLRIARELLPDWQREAAARQFFNLLEQLLESPQKAISTFSLLTPQEQREMVVEWNDTKRSYPLGKGLHQLFEAQVKRSSESIALITGERSVSYGDLNSQANQMAHALIDLGVCEGSLVAMLLPRSVEMVVTLLAILKAGGAYVPLDMDDPPTLVRGVLEEALPVVLVTKGDVSNVTLNQANLSILDLDEVDLQDLDSGNLDLPSPPDQLLNCLYTSGSSGRPKGVLGTHSGTVNLVKWLQETFPFKPDEVACLKTTIGFVDFLWEFFTPLLSGIPIVLVPELMVRDPRDLLSFLDRHRVTRLVLVPSLLNSLLHNNGSCNSLKYFLISGEPLTQKMVGLFHTRFPDAQLINAYGSTEASGVSTCWNAEHDKCSPPIGRPIANTFVRILGPDLDLLPMGAWGELYVGGVGLATGYLHDQILTDQKFVQDPIAGQGRCYRSGDEARYLPDGEIQFRGRLDRQLKISGVRIEPGEIKHMLLQHRDVQSVRVAAVNVEPEKLQLVAWVVFTRNAKSDAASLRRYLCKRLPTNRVPARYVFLSEMPLNSRGKIDTPALIKGLSAAPNEPDIDQTATPLEQSVMECWKNFLPVTGLRRDSQFFESGGDSLMAAQVLVELERRLGVHIPLGTMIEANTPRLLAAALSENVGSHPSCSSIELRPGQSGKTLFLLPTIGGALFRYRHLLDHLPVGLRVVGLQINRMDAESDSDIDFTAIAKELMVSLKEVQPDGPYRLAGFCFGGVLALELARILEQTGERVEFLGLVETWAPGFMDRVKTASRLNDFDTANWTGRLGFHIQALKELKGLERWRYLSRVARRNLYPSAEPATSLQLLERRNIPTKIMDMNLQALRGYKPESYQGDVSLFRAAHSWRKEKVRDLGWGQWLKGQVAIVDVPGYHTFVLEEPWVRRLGRDLSAALDGKS